MIKSICVDTLTALQTDEYMTDKRKPGFDKFKDYGQTIYSFIYDLQQRGFELILILGEPGTGKSSGQRTLEHDTNIWYNADNKNPVWTGGTEEYGRKSYPRTPYHKIPQTYQDIITHIDLGLTNNLFAPVKFAFLTAHTESFQVGNDKRERLKTLGNMATKMQLEGKMETVLYSRVEMDKGNPVYILETQNNGYNTARSPQAVFEGKIPNDYKLILDKLGSL